MIKRIQKKLEEVYQDKPHRLQHVLAVRDTALILGKRYKVDLFKLEMAALLHDITKYYPHQKQVEIILEHYANGESILEEYNPKILHAFSAVYVAKEEFGIMDEEVLNAIMSHTIGRPNMSIYEKIIFISDYIEPNRTYVSCVRVRQTVEESLDLAVYEAINDSIVFHEKANAVIPKTAYDARTYYKKILEEKDGKNSSTNSSN